MKHIYKNYPRLFFLLLALVNVWLVVAIVGCSKLKENITSNTTNNYYNLQDLKNKKTIRVGVQLKAAEMFLNKNQHAGYLYELINDFANEIETELQIVELESDEEKIKKLINGEVDIIAGVNDNFLIDSIKNKIAFTDPISSSQLVLLQKNNADKFVKNFEDLKEEKVYTTKNIQKNSIIPIIEKENNLNIWVLENNTNQFELIEDVINGKVDYAIVENTYAKLFTLANKNLNTSFVVTKKENKTLATLKKSESLTASLDDWLDRKTDNFNLFSKYLQYYKKEGNYNFNKSIAKNASLAQYDDLILQYAKKINVDWQLVAAIISQESNFKFDVKSKSGAIGLMQVMPRTAKSYGVTDLYNPNENMKAGTMHLKWLENYWNKRILDKDEKLNFILASYNCGSGHVEDARRLALKYGKNPDVWHNNVDQYILNKAKRKYFKDPVVKHGFCNGKETYNYVLKVLNKYYKYKVNYSNKGMVKL